MRTKETTSTWMSRVEATQKRGRDWLALFFFYLLKKVMYNRDSFISLKYCNLLQVPFCFILQSNRLSEPDKLSGISQVMERSWENYSVRLALSFSKQLVQITPQARLFSISCRLFQFFLHIISSWCRHANEKSNMVSRLYAWRPLEKPRTELFVILN